MVPEVKTVCTIYIENLQHIWGRDEQDTTALHHLDKMPAKVLKNIEGCKAFPSDQSQIPDGKYLIASDEERSVEAVDADIKAEIWFKTPVSLESRGGTPAE